MPYFFLALFLPLSFFTWVRPRAVSEPPNSTRGLPVFSPPGCLIASHHRFLLPYWLALRGRDVVMRIMCPVPAAGPQYPPPAWRRGGGGALTPARAEVLAVVAALWSSSLGILPTRSTSCSLPSARWIVVLLSGSLAVRQQRIFYTLFRIRSTSGHTPLACNAPFVFLRAAPCWLSLLQSSEIGSNTRC